MPYGRRKSSTKRAGSRIRSVVKTVVNYFAPAKKKSSRTGAKRTNRRRSSYGSRRY